MLFSEFASYLDKLEKTSSRLAITDILSELFKYSDKDEIDKVIYLSLGILAPNYEGIILNLAEKMMLRVLSDAYNKPTNDVLKIYKANGDIGDTAQELAKYIVHSTKYTVGDVYTELRQIAKDNGAGSQERKIEKTAMLLKNLDPLSVRFVARIPVGRLRLGFSEKTIIDSLRLAALAQGHGTSQEEIESAYNVRPDIGFIAKLVKENKLKEVSPKIGVPIVPMLAARLNSPAEMIKKMGEVAVEPKFDGLRIFIHFNRFPIRSGMTDSVKIFTRNMNALDPNIFPELLEVGKYIKANEVILDTEAVGLDEKREKFVDFQKTIQRRRKHEIAENSAKTPLQFQVFDILLVDGSNQIGQSYQARRRELEKVVINGGILKIDESMITKDPNVISELHNKYLKMGLEGVVVKKINAAYVSGRTGWNWVKMKEVEGTRGKLADTIDCVVMGYTAGKGKRVGFGVGQFLAGIKDGENYKTITKVGTGLTDEQFRELNNRLKKIITKEKPKEYEVNKDLVPDYWVEPKEVVELAADEITISPKHTAGLALRFPRLIKFRDDKKADQCTNKEELNDLFKLQKNK